MTTVTRPRVFVSSTVRDFRDLRDALKFWLEEMGYEVQLSEYTDFEHPPEDGTFEACFRAIRDSDYYLLLIGERRGSWYSEPDRVTVTRQEYRTAYEAFLATGRPKPITLVRQSVIVALKERTAAGVSPETGSTLQDAEFTADFLAEVGREAENETATKGEAPYPAGNWITPFAAFRALIDGVRSSLQIRGPLPRIAQEETLRHELKRNLRMMIHKHRGKPFYRHFYLDSVREEVELPPNNEALVRLSFQQIKRAHMYLFVGPIRPDTFVRTALNEAISSGSFLDYSFEDDRFQPSPVLDALYRLREELDVYAARYAVLSELQAVIWPLYDAVHGSKSDGDVPVLTLVDLFGFHDTQRNIARLLLGILRYLYGHSETIDVQYRPISPLPGEDEKIEAERVSQDEINAWLQEDSRYLALGTRDLTEEEKAQTDAMWQKLRQALGDDFIEKIKSRLVELVSEGNLPTDEELRRVVEDVFRQTAKDDEPS